MTFKAHGKQNDWLTEGRQKKNKKRMGQSDDRIEFVYRGKADVLQRIHYLLKHTGMETDG